MSAIISKILARVINLKLWRISHALKSEFAEIKHGLDEHLQAINENTNEISANYEYICEIEHKLDRMSERLDQIQMFLEQSSSYAAERRNSFEVRRLSEKEKQVFLVIYTLEEGNGLTYEDIARKLGISVSLAGNYVTSIIEKGVPIVKKYINSRPYLRLDQEFKTLQAKENILQVSLSEYF